MGRNYSLAVLKIFVKGTLGGCVKTYTNHWCNYSKFLRSEILFKEVCAEMKIFH
ncbi:MAG: hypothetical protein MjAS7_2047 [Metallosphaera javensis (ex Sakai et al. 2022)]|nr:MAG: hypothetical protein MjAS7_2047 [Metallosphaera javensis (ex Sakai et al. 2022)]